MTNDAWVVEGTLLIACNCDYGCPCNVNGLPTTGKCEGGWTWHVETGRYGTTPLDGLNFSIFADWPGAIHDGGGRAVAYLDEHADETQEEAITTLMRGGAGGPWAIFINTYDLEGPHRAPYDVDLADEHSTCRIGDVSDLQVEPITNATTGEAIHPRLLLPEGLLVRDIGLFASKRFSVKGNVSYDHSGRYAAIGAFSNAGP